MAKVTLAATGGLNRDMDPNNLPQGDYSDATNIVFDAGKNGGAGAIRMLESFANTNLSYTDPVKATFQESNGLIYVLTAGATKAGIHVINTDISTTTELFIYTHGVTTDFTPDLKVYGNSIIWNYAGDGIVLLHPLDRTVPTISGRKEYTNISDLKLQKRTPNQVVTIKKSFTGSPIELLESGDFQFASRYKYDSGEFSVLSNFSQMFKGEKGTTQYDIAYNFTDTPTYVSEIELYVREGNIGLWRRADTQAKGVNTTIAWVGQTFESLDIITSSKPFDAVPVNAKHLEIAKNRLFLANMKDDFDAESGNKLTFTTASGYALGTSGDARSYLGSGTTYSATSSETSYTGTDYVKPFANNSVYNVGIAYYDEALKTRGVEAYSQITTGKFAYPIIPNVIVTPSTGWVKPSWAKYAQLVYTKNNTKSYVYEGFASNVFFELNITEENPVTKAITKFVGVSQSITKDQLKDLRFLVVDLMGMFKSSQFYTLEKGDKISINVGTLAAPNILDMEVKEQKDNFVYCLYTGGALTMPTIPVCSDLYFEIYSPKQTQEDEALVFYESGSLVDITSWAVGTPFTFSGTGTINSTKLTGDMVFSKISIPTYASAPFKYSFAKTDPPVYTEDIRTIVNCAMTSETIDLGTFDIQNTVTKKLTPTFTSFGAFNEDVAKIVDANKSAASTGTQFMLSNFYDNAKQTPGVNKITITYNLKLDYTINYVPRTDGNDPQGNYSFLLESQIRRIPFENKLNVYLNDEAFGKPESFVAAVGSYSATTGTIPVYFIHTINMPTDLNVNINANDVFYLSLTATAGLSGEVTTATGVLSKATSGTAIVYSMNMDKTASKTITYYNPAATLNTSNTNFIVRNISNATTNPKWNTSAGKPSYKAELNVTNRRTNTIRYSGTYIAGTKVNNFNSFFALDSNDVPIENGGITSLQRASRLQGNGSMLLALCERECSYIFMGEQELSQGDNSSIRSLTNNLIGTIRNLGDGVGLQDKISVMNYKGTIWWWDDYNKKILKYTDKGVDVVSNKFMKSFFLSQSGSMRFAYDPYYNMCFVGSIGGNISYGFSDVLDRWIAKYSFRTGFSESYGSKMVLFKDSKVYTSLGSTYNTFFDGTAYDGDISLLMNSRYPVLPRNIAVWHDMNVIDWTQSNYIKTNLFTIDITNENNQVTKLMPSNFIVEDNRMYAHILRDKNTTGSIVEANLITGNYIVGYLNKFVVTLKDRTQGMRLNSFDIEVEPVSGHS
jgi:hypothetical protein